MFLGSYSEKAGSLRNKKLSIVDIIHKQQASDEVKLSTCQIPTCAGVGEHMFASGDWLSGGTANVKESRVCQVLENLYFKSLLHFNCQSYTISFCCSSVQHT